MTIEVDGFFRVHAEQSFDFADENGFTLDGTAPRLVNEGSLSLTVTADAAEPAGLFVATADDAMIWNRAGASIRLDEAAGATVGSAIFALSGADQLVRNDGEIRVTSGDSILPVLASGYALHLVNTGLFRVDAAEIASLGAIREDARISNSGVIAIHGGSESRGLSILGSSSAPGVGQLINSGVFLTAGDGAFALNLRDAYNGYHLDNSGRIIARALDPAGASIAIYLPSFATGQIVIDNSGLIQGEWAITGELGQGSGELLLRNSGKIIGDISLNGDGDHVVNSGLIVGDVDLAYGADVYDGRDGRLQGELSGGYHSDTLHGGRSGEVIYGDYAAEETWGAGDDLVDGGGGSDSLYGGYGADTLRGGLGADQLHGGAGADVFIYAAAAESQAGGEDLIADLDAADVIDLSRIDADITRDGNQHFTLVSAFTGHAGELAISYDAGTDESLLQADTDGDGSSDFQVRLTGDQTGFSSFVL